MKKIYYLYFVLVFAIIFMWFVILTFPDSKLRIVTCDVGQGDAILIMQGVNQILVDGGPNNNVLTCLGKHMPFWDRKIEMVILTHPDRDHYYGLVETTNRYQIGKFVFPSVDKSDSNYQKLLDNLSKRHISTTHAHNNDTIKIGDLYLYIVWPTKEFSKVNKEGNLLSIVFNLRYKNFSALFTGDIEPPAIDELAQTGQLIDIDILKVPHHGSKNGLTESLFLLSKPEVAIISSGKDNQWGHPNKETLDILRNTKVYRTDQIGEFEIIVTDQGYQVLP